MIGNVVYTIAILAIVLGILVFVHELGHYIAAKAFGVWVHRFAIGIGKPVPGLTFHRGETEWAIAWLPLGGYVKMASRELDPAAGALEGPDDDNAHVPPNRVFEAKPVWQRLIIILAGVTMNAVFALLIFTGLAWKNGEHYDPTTTVAAVIDSELPAQAKAVAQLAPGTRIVSIDGHPVTSWDDIMQRITEGSTNEIVLHFDHAPDLTVPLHRDDLVQRAALAGALEPVTAPVLGEVDAGMPAAEAGLAVGDSIIAVDSTPVRSWSDIVARIQPAAGQAVSITVMRDRARRTFTVTPRSGHANPADPTSPVVGRIGVAVRTPYVARALSLGGAIQAGADAWASAAGTIYRTLRGVADGRVSTKEVGGPILIGQMAAQQARAGLDPLLAFIALISVNLAIVNLLPVPILDGGSVVFLLAEAVIRRPLPMRVREALSLAGLAFLALLMVVVFKNDIARLLGH